MKKSARKPTNMLKLSRKPSLKKSAVLAEAEKIVKERKKAEKAAKKSAPKTAVKTEKKPAVKKPAVKKTAAKKSPAKKSSVKKGARDPMWKNLAKALRRPETY